MNSFHAFLIILAGSWLSIAPAHILAAAAPTSKTSKVSNEAPAAVASSLVVDKGRVEFVATGWPSALRIRGKGDRLAGTLVVEEQGLSGDVAFELQSLDTGIGMRNRHMHEQYLETGKYPRAVFRPTSVLMHKLPASQSFGTQETSFEGELELHGVTRPVRGTARVRRDGPEVEVEAKFGIRTSDFKIATPRYMGITVAEDVEVTVKFAGALDGTGGASK